MPRAFSIQGQQKGFILITDSRGTVEQETFTCGHCNNVIRVPHRANPDDLGGMCRICMSMVCGPCVEKRECDPFEKKLKRIEDRSRFLGSIG